jgi:hypothetical protein
MLTCPVPVLRAEALAPGPPRAKIAPMPPMNTPRPRPSFPLAAAPVAVRVVVGLGLLGLCAWLPAFVALFR